MVGKLLNQSVKLNAIIDKDYAEYLFTQGFFTEDRNSNNYSIEKFNYVWDKWLSFYSIVDQEETVGFCGVRDYGKYARIFDRYFIYPEFRKQGVAVGEYCQHIIKPLLNDIETHIPFFSIEYPNRKNAINKAVNSINSVLDQSQQFHVLNDIYETAENSWQYVAIQVPHTDIDLPKVYNGL